MRDASPFLLLVEDDPNDILLFQRALRKLGSGIPMTVARDGEEAICRLGGEEPFSDRSRHPLPTHLVLDLKLPRRSGHEVLEWVRAHPGLNHLPVVILTSSKELADLARVERSRVDRYCVKPPNFADLILTVRGILEGWNLLP